MMNKKLLAILFLCMVVLSANCQKSQNSSSYSNSNDGKLRTSHMTITNDGLSLEIKHSGEVRFNDDETAIQSLEPGGKLLYRRNDQKLTAEIDDKGNISYEMYDGNTKLSINDAAGKQFLANVIKELINHGIDAKGSVERLYKKGGSAGVMKRVETLKSDYAKSIYLGYLLEQQPNLSAAELSTIAEKTGTLINSDYEKAKVLSKSSERFMADPKSAQAYFTAAKTINSDYEKAKVLKGVLGQNLSAELYGQAIDLTRGIHSDYEKAGVLKGLIEKGKVEGANYQKLLDMIALINSDYEKAGVALRLIEKGIPNQQAYDQFVKVTAAIHSDYEHARVLKRLLDQPIPAGVNFDQVLSLINNIGSDYERAGVLKKVSNKELSTEQWVSLIRTASGINSNYEKSGVLLQIVKMMPKNEKTEEAYRQAAKTVTSDYEFGKVMKALE